MRKKKKLYLSFFCCSLLLAENSLALAASAISVPPEARNTAAAAIAAAEDVEFQRLRRKYHDEAENFLINAHSEADSAGRQFSAAQRRWLTATNNLQTLETEKYTFAQEAEEAEAQSQNLHLRYQNLYAAANQAQAKAQSLTAQPQLTYATGEVSQNPSTSSPQRRADLDPLLQAEKEMREKESLYHKEKAARAANQAVTTVPAVSAATQQASAAQTKAAALSAQAAQLGTVSRQAAQQAEQKRQAASQKESSYNNAFKEATDAQQIYLAAADYNLRAQNNLFQATQNYEDLLAEQSKTYSSYFTYSGARYYSWKDNEGNKGYQIVEPKYFGYWTKKFSYGIYTSFVHAHNHSRETRGHVQTLTDTYLLLVKQSETAKLIFDYSLGINIPTGKSALNWPQRYARMNEDLMEVDQFGKGWQLLPTLAVSWKPYERDTWTIGTSYLYSTSYDPTSDIPNDNIKPGGEWGRWLRYQHAGEKWQLVVKLLNTAYGRTKISNGESYKTNEAWEYQITYNRKLNDKQNLMFYYWPTRQARNDIFPLSTTNALVHYYGSMWSNKLTEKSTLRVTFDVMDTNGPRYSGIHNYYDFYGNPRYLTKEVDGRKKYTLGVGYDYKINAKQSINLDIQHFKMKDGPSSIGEAARNFHGWNIFLLYNRSF